MSTRTKTIAARVLTIAAGLLVVTMIVNLVLAWRAYQSDASTSDPFVLTILMNLAVFMGPALVLLAVATVLTLRPKISAADGSKRRGGSSSEPIL